MKEVLEYLNLEELAAARETRFTDGSLKSFEQPEEFWRAFEAYFGQRAAELRQQRVWLA